MRGEISVGGRAESKASDHVYLPRCKHSFIYLSDQEKEPWLPWERQCRGSGDGAETAEEYSNILFTHSSGG